MSLGPRDLINDGPERAQLPRRWALGTGIRLGLGTRSCRPDPYAVNMAPGDCLPMYVGTHALPMSFANLSLIVHRKDSAPPGWPYRHTKAHGGTVGITIPTSPSLQRVINAAEFVPAESHIDTALRARNGLPIIRC